MTKIVIVGGGWAGVSAAIGARKQGCEVILVEKTDLLLGLGNVGGIMRNNGRFTAAEENIAMGAGELFEITDRFATHKNVDFPGHKHASFYDVNKVEPEVGRLIREMGIETKLMTRVTDVVSEENRREYAADALPGAKSIGIRAVKTAEGKTIEGDVFVEATGSTGPMGNCMKYGNGCSMCVLRCPSFGPRVSITSKAGKEDIMGMRADGSFGAFSGAGKLIKESLSEEIRKKLNETGVAVIPLPKEEIKEEKLGLKVCQQYALTEYAENIILLDTGYAKIMTPFFPLDRLRSIPGFENARYADPYAGGKGNSIRYLSVAERDDFMRAESIDNLLVAGEKSGLFVGHTEAISTGSLAGYNAARYLKGIEPLSLPRTLAVGDLISYANEQLETKKGLMTRYTFAGAGFFERMKEKNIYTVDCDEIKKRVAQCGLRNIYKEKLI